MEKVTIEQGFELLHKRNKGNFFMEVEVVELLANSITSSGNYYARLIIKDQTREAILVVWGSEKNRTNLNHFQKATPRSIRVITPIKPAQWAILEYDVDFWAHESRSKIEVID